jgi:hypothetical protein
VKFSQDDERRLTTCGAGHIRFWNLAATFTGLKLQGYIGKFGKAELSDIGAFTELSDGRVVSGTHGGSLLLWEDNFIKCRYVRSGGLSCHSGEVTYVGFDREERKLITASIDGYIRWWNIDIIEASEVDSDRSIDFEIQPDVEYYLGDGRGIVMMVDGGLVGDGRTFYIVDTAGCSRRIYFYLGEELEETPKPGQIKRRTLRDVVEENPVKKMRKLCTVLKNMKSEHLNLNLNGSGKMDLFRISECVSPIEKSMSAEVEVEVGEGKGVKLEASLLDNDNVDVTEAEMKLSSSRVVKNNGVHTHTSANRDADITANDRPITHEFSNYHSGCITGTMTVPPFLLMLHFDCLTHSLLYTVFGTTFTCQYVLFPFLTSSVHPYIPLCLRP